MSGGIPSVIYCDVCAWVTGLADPPRRIPDCPCGGRLAVVTALLPITFTCGTCQRSFWGSSNPIELVPAPKPRFPIAAARCPGCGGGLVVAEVPPPIGTCRACGTQHDLEGQLFQPSARDPAGSSGGAVLVTLAVVVALAVIGVLVRFVLA